MSVPEARPVCGNAPVCAIETCAHAHTPVWGTGLTPGWLTGILTLAIVMFLFWGGPLWQAPTGTSHVMRIGGSYLLVPPVVMVAQRCLGTASVKHAVSAVAVIWAAKLVITSGIYALVSPGGADRYAPIRPWERDRDNGGRR